MTEKTTRIESSIFTSHHLEITDWLDGDMGLNIHKHGSDLGGVTVKRADLLAALDATANTDVKHRADAYEAATEAQRKLTDAERDLRLTRAELQQVKKLEALEHKRAEQAEAALERVRALFDSDTGYETPEEALADLRAALNPFTLPTEVPARIEAKRDGKTYTFYLWTNGTGGSNDLIWVDEDDWTHSPSPERLLERFTDHRLIGAEV